MIPLGRCCTSCQVALDTGGVVKSLYLFTTRSKPVPSHNVFPGVFGCFLGAGLLLGRVYDSYTVRMANAVRRLYSRELRGYVNARPKPLASQRWWLQLCLRLSGDYRVQQTTRKRLSRGACPASKPRGGRARAAAATAATAPLHTLTDSTSPIFG